MEIKKENRYDYAYLKLALEWSKLSYCSRKKVGSLIVKNNMIISDGYNGTPTGFNNICENNKGISHWYVLHAEANAILKTAKSNHNCSGATLYLTLSPCKDCSKLIHQAGIKRLVYIDQYKDTSGLDFLKEAGVTTKQVKKLDLLK
jgi:dCMP deaminase|tara:strand:- start:3667 stop:4104 length:438 start_codon:yes stop_codon:yes gene_type:complete